jgi:hypothetical protein
MSALDQEHVAAWVREALGEETASNVPERSLRTVEEAVELAQACGVSAESLHRLIDYVFSRPPGDPSQEIAGTMVTLYSTAAALNVDADEAFYAELARIRQPEVMERCRVRQAEKRKAMATLWWLSYADEKVGFLGVVITRADSFLEACLASKRLGVSPGGQVRGFPLPGEAESEIKPEDFDRLLNEEELKEYRVP